MPTITSIKPQKNKKRVNIHLDGKFGFGLDLENFVKLKLSVGKRLSDEAIKRIVEKSEYQKILNNLLRFATLRPRSEKEIKDWFYKKKVPETLQDKLKSRLKKLDLLNDEKFSKWWIGQRLSFKYKSKRELEYELRQKGIEKKLVDQVISDQVNQELEINNAKKLLEKNSFRWKKYSGFEKNNKQKQYLARKGFGWDVIRNVIGDL